MSTPKEHQVSEEKQPEGSREVNPPFKFMSDEDNNVLDFTPKVEYPNQTTEETADPKDSSAPDTVEYAL